MKEKKVKLQNQKGITLIALVITIIVLLILAGVSIAMLTGENGILGQATSAKEKTVEAKEKEAVALAITTIKAKITKELNETNLEEEIVALEGEDNVTVVKDGNFYKVTFNNTKNGYLVTEKGTMFDPAIKLDVDYEEDSGIIYLTPNYPNLEEVEELFDSEEDYLRTILSLNTFEENEKIFVHYNSVFDMADEIITEPYKNSDQICTEYFDPYTSIEEIVADEGIEKEEWIINTLIGDWMGFYTVENPDGSVDYGYAGSNTQYGYSVEEPGEYKFKITFLGTTVEKVITVE